MSEVLKLFGPPGTGKTHTLLDFLENELKAGVHPKRIAYLSFTVAARREASERAQASLDIDPDDLVHFKTLHSIAYRQLDMTRTGLITQGEDLQDFGDMVGMEFRSKTDAAGASFGFSKPDRFLAFDHYRRHRGLTALEAFQDWPDALPWYEIEFFCRQYQEWKTDQGWTDFTDLLEAGRGLHPLDVDVVFVDEAQDLSRLQWKALDIIASKAARIYIAGDDDQAIFSWAGAEPDEFLRRPGETRVLDQSYRLPRSVHSMAGNLIQRIEGPRQAKTWKPREEEGSVLQRNSVKSMTIPEEGSVLILYRSHYVGKDPEEWLRLNGHPYAFNDRRAPGLDHAPAVIAWHKLTKGEAVSRDGMIQVLEAMKGTADSQKMLRKMDRGRTFKIGDFPLHAPDVMWWDALDKLPREEIQYLRAIGKSHGPKVLVEAPRIRLSTIHAAKGAEADHVLLFTDVSKATRETIEHRPDAEIRVFYVGITRARETLTLIGDPQRNPLLKGLAA